MGKRILVVDDEPDMILLMQMMLEKSGFEVVTANDGKAGLEKAKSQKPDLIILDVLMPKVLGHDLRSLLLEDPETLNIPIIFLTNVPLRFITGNKEKENELQQDKRGNYLLPKSCSKEQLLSAISRILPV